MPTTRHRRERFRRPDIDEIHWAILSDLEFPEDADLSGEFTYSWDVGRELWRKHRDRILDDWIAETPGTRPSQWWRYDSPAEPRKQTGGTGKPIWRQYCAIARKYAFGLPTSWVDGIPEFESQHRYLARLNLLRPGEGEPREEPVPLPGGFMHWECYSLHRERTKP